MKKSNCLYADKQNTDIAVLQTEMNDVKLFIKDMNDNHLPHLYTSINDIKIQLAYWAGGITIIVLASQILIQIFLK